MLIRRRIRRFAIPGFVLCLSGATAAQTAAPDPPADDERAQYPAILANSFVSINVGSIGYPFSDRQLEPGYQVESIAVPHVAVRAVLLGRHFGKYLSAQATYLRPVRYVKYRNIDGHGTRSVWMHFGTVTLLARVPVSDRLSMSGEGGLAITSRAGFEIDESPVVKDAHFSSLLVGAGVEYRVNRTWDLVAGVAYIPSRARDRQPATTLTSAGFRYNMRPLPEAQVAATRAAGFIFPKHTIQFGYTTNALGYRANHFVSRTVPIFWGGKVEVKRSVVNLQYQRNLFHTKKVFSLDVGARFGQWTSRNNGERFHTLAVYPLLRFTFLRLAPADLYASYSVAGPSYISRRVIDGRQTGGHFTFQDFMAIGAFIGGGRHLNVEVELNHYSNGNILLENAGVKIPLTFKAGYAF